MLGWCLRAVPGADAEHNAAGGTLEGGGGSNHLHGLALCCVQLVALVLARLRKAKNYGIFGKGLVWAAPSQASGAYSSIGLTKPLYTARRPAASRMGAAFRMKWRRSR